MKKRVLLCLIALFKVLYGAVYAPLKLLPMQRKVVMISRQSNKLRPDFEQIGAALAKRDPSVRIVYLCRMIGDTLPARIGYGFHLLRCAAQLATASVCIVDGYCIPVSMLKHRPGLRIVQVWHALGAVKKFGRQALAVPPGGIRTSPSTWACTETTTACSARAGAPRRSTARRSAFRRTSCA